MAPAPPKAPAFNFLICPDSDLIREQIETLLEKFPGGGGRQKFVFWGDQEPVPDFWDKLTCQELFAAPRAVIIRQANLWTAAVWKSLSAALAKVPSGIWPFFCLEVDMEKGKFKVPAHILKTRCMVFAEKQGWVWRQQGLAGPALQNFVKSHAQKMGLAFSPAALNLFCQQVIPQAGAVRNELEKLRLISQDGKVDTEHVAVDSGNPESNAFVCLKKLENGDLPGVWAEVARTNSANLLFFLIAIIAREFRQFWQIQMGESVYLRPAEETFKKNLARALGPASVSRGFSALAEAEFKVKSGAQTPEQTLEFLCMEMARLFKPLQNKAPG